MESPRALTARRVARGLACAKCFANLLPLPDSVERERLCERCEARPHRILMNFQYRAGWAVQFSNAAGSQSLSGWFPLRDQNGIRDLAIRGKCADLNALEHSIATWGRGSIHLHLTDEQYRTLMLKSRRRPPQRA